MFWRKIISTFLAVLSANVCNSLSEIDWNLCDIGSILCISRARQLMADQAVITGPSIDQAIGNRDVRINIIIPKSSLTSEESQQLRRLLRDKLELKLVPDENVKIGVAMNERIAGIAFPDLKGKMDFNSGFTSGSIDFHRWCRDLFSCYWNSLKNPS